jgi:phage repressor protein C with HTH and peptisase S24 domain
MDKVMHESARRLFEAAKKVRPEIESPADLARVLNQSEQAINNWSYRGNGVSKQGRLLAQKELGISATWIEDETGPMFVAREHNFENADGPMKGDDHMLLAESIEARRANVDPEKLTPAQRLKAALISGVTAETLASVAGVGVDVASLWLAGEGAEITLAQAAAIQTTYGINMVWLTKGKGDPGVAIRYADDWNPIPISDMFGVPVRGRAQLGDNGYWADLEYPDGHGDGYVDVPKKNKDMYALKCVGDSMRPRIKNGEYVVVDPHHAIAPGDEVLVRSKDGRVMVKEFLYKRAGRIHLISINESHPPITLDEDKVDKLHYVASINKPSQWRPD